MALPDSFEGTYPAALAEPKQRIPAVVTTERKDLALVGDIGLTLSDSVLVIQRVIEGLALNGPATPAQIAQLTFALDSVRTVARHSQQIARLGSGNLRQSHEKLKLDTLVSDTLQERAPLFRQLGVQVQHGIKPVEVMVDAGLLVCLLDAALEWALSMGRKLIITLEMKNWPEHGVLQIRASDKPPPEENSTTYGEETGNALTWALLAETAGAMGVLLDRRATADESVVTLEFARTVKRLEGLTAMDVDTGYDTLAGDTRSIAGHRVLVVARDDVLRTEIENTARLMGLTTDFVTDTRNAVKFCHLETPHMVIIDERARDDAFDELCKNLRLTDSNYPLIEIVNQPNVLETAAWMLESITRVSRASLRKQLGPILAMELAKAD